MKKICFVTTVSATLSAFLTEFAAYLHESGEWDVTFICNTDEEFAKSLPEYIRYIPVPMKRGVSFDGLRVSARLKKIFWAEKFDIVQYATPNAALYASGAAKRAGVPVRLYTQWGIRYMGFEGWRRLLFKALEKRVCKNSTRIEPESFGMRDFAVSEGLYAPERAEVIGHGSACGVNLEKYDISKRDIWRDEIRGRLGFADGDTVFGFAARLCRDKGINELLAAFCEARETLAATAGADGDLDVTAAVDNVRDTAAADDNDTDRDDTAENDRAGNEKADSAPCLTDVRKRGGIKLLVMGGVDDEASLDKELFARARDCGDVIFTGRVGEMMKYYSALDVFVSPSWREGFGLVLTEAQAMGTPVIATDVPGQIDAFVPGETGLAVALRDVDALRDAIVKMYSDGEMRRRMGEAARRFAAENFEQKALFALLERSRADAVRTARK